MQVFVELGDYLAGFEALAVAGGALDPTGHHAHQRQVFLESADHVGPQHLHRHLAAAGQGGKVNLRNRGAGHGRHVKGFKNTV